MKLRLIMSLALLASFHLSAETVRLSEPVFTDEFSETFGQVLNETLPAVNLAKLLETPEKYDEFLLTTRISKVCKKKGCFFIAQEGEHVIRVAFKDYGFFIPTDSNGKIVTLAGTLISKEVSAEQAAHFNQDMGNKGVLNAGKTYEIVADSVKIPRT